MNRPADLLLTNGKVITVDERFSIAQAIAIEGDRFRAVGANAELAALQGPQTEVIDLGGRAVMPGLVDGHAHMDREGLKLVFPSLGRVRSIGDIQDRIAELARGKRPGEWIVTMPIGDPPAYFDVPNILREQRFPTRRDLDLAAPRNPVYIRPIWGFWRHTTPLVSIANSAALAMAGIDRDTAPPVPSVTIERDDLGEPTGVFYENTMMPIVELSLMRKVPGFTRADRARTLPQACAAYHAFGTTSIFEEHGVATELVRAYKDARANGTLTMRTAMVLSPSWRSIGNAPFAPFIDGWCGWLGEPSLGDDFLKMTGIMVDIDPTLENNARLQSAPYTGWAGFNYDTGLPRERARELLMACARNDIRVVGIWPNMIDLFFEVHQKIPLSDRRWIIGHISTLADRDMDRLAEMGVVMTSHTNRYIWKESHLLAERLGAKRVNEISPLQSLAKRGVRVSLATDNVPVSLFHPIWQSVARRNRYTKEVVAPAECLTREQALRGATSNGAYLTFDETKKGSIEPGKLADLAVLSADPLTCAEEALADIHATLTMVGGKVVYRRPE